MTAGIWLPGPAPRVALDDRSPALFSFDAADMVRRYTLTARSGQAATFSRAGPAYTRDANDRLALVNHSQPRIEAIAYNGFDEPCLLLERAATNALTAPENLSNAAWTKGATTVVADAVAAPVGHLPVTADTLMETGAVGVHYVVQTVTGFTANTTQSARVYVRPNGRSRIRFSLISGAGDDIGVVATLSGSGSSTTYQAGSGVVSHHRCVALGDGWYEVELAGVMNASGTSGSLLLELGTASAFNYLGDVTKGAYVWGLMFEKNVRRPSTYCETSRLVDVLTYPFNARPGSLTMYARFVMRNPYESSQAIGVLSVGGGAAAADPRTFLFIDGGGFGVQFTDGVLASSRNVAPSPDPSYGDWIELRGVLRSDGAVNLGVAVNGGTEQTGVFTAAATPPATLAAWGVAQIDLGRYTASTTGINPIRRALVLAGERSLQECRGSW